MRQMAPSGRMVNLEYQSEAGEMEGALVVLVSLGKMESETEREREGLRGQVDRMREEDPS